MIEPTVFNAADVVTPVTTDLDILLVEDSRANQLLMSSLLKNIGYQVSVAENGLAAIKLIQQRLPAVYDLILMDLQMPELDGYSATKIIRGWQNAAAKVPIFAISASDSADDYQKCYAAGMQACVPKPFQIDELVVKIEQFVQRDDRHDMTAPTAENSQEKVGIIDDKTLSELQQSLSPEAVQRMLNTFLVEAEQRLQTLQQLASFLNVTSATVVNSTEVHSAEVPSCSNSDSNDALNHGPKHKFNDNEAAIDWLGIQRELHTLKSLSGSFAAQAMFELSIRLEQQAKQQQFTQSSFEKLQDLLQKTKLAFIELGLH